MLIVKMIFGSHLYGTATPASDQDFKGVALPTWEQLALGKVPKHAEHTSTGQANSKNTADDVDTEIFSLHEFVKLGIEGQTVAMDMIHAPAKMFLHAHAIWWELQAYKSHFYSKSVHSFIGYAMGQAAKYGVKGSRLNDAKAVLEWLEKQPATAKLLECDLATFPQGEHIRLMPSDNPLVQNQYDVCGRKIQLTSRVQYAAEIVNHFYSNYGERAKQAARDEGIDWKAVSHAFRAAYQMRELFTDGTITFPRPEAKLLTEIKTGQRKYLDVAPMLEDLIDEVKALREWSKFPEKPDRQFWDNFLLYVAEEYILPSRAIARSPRNL